MRNLLLLISVFMLVACNRANHQRKLSQETINAIINQQIEDSLSIETNESKTASTVENTETEVVQIEFDTDKPADPETGKPPVKNMTITRTRSNSENNSQKESNTKAQNAHRENTNVDIDKEKKEDMAEEKKTEVFKPPSFLKSILYILAIVGFYFLHDVIRKNWSKIKSLWKK